MSTTLTSDEVELWQAAFCHPSQETPPESAIYELANYFHIRTTEAAALLANAKSNFANEWVKAGIALSDEAETARFYRQNTNEIFELMEWHSNPRGQATQRYMAALRALRTLRPGAAAYLDYGSGTGTGGVLFAKAGMRVSLADISIAQLEFCRWRFQERGLQCECIDLEQVGLPAAAYDIVTCFDVLEHVGDPLRIVRQIRDSLKPGGLFVLRVSFVQDEAHPMHIGHDPLMPYSLEALGFSYHFDVASPSVQVMVKTGLPETKTPAFSRALAAGSKAVGYDAFHAEEYGRARGYFLKSLRHNPLQPGLLPRLAASCLPSPVIHFVRQSKGPAALQRG